MKKPIRNEALISQLRDDSAKLPQMGWIKNSAIMQNPELSEIALEQKLVILPKILNNAHQSTAGMPNFKPNLLGDRLLKEQDFKRNSLINQGDLSMRMGRKYQKELSGLAGIDEQSWGSSKPLNKAVGMDSPAKIALMSRRMASKQRILTDMSINEDNFLDNSPVKQTQNLQLKIMPKKKTNYLSPDVKSPRINVEEKRKRFPDRKNIRSNYSRPRKLITDLNELEIIPNQSSSKVLLKQVTFQSPQTDSNGSPFSLFSEIQSTLSRRQTSNLKPSTRCPRQIFFFKDGVSNPESRIKQLESKLRRMQTVDSSHHAKTDISQAPSEKEYTKNLSRPFNERSWRRVNVTNSASHLVVEQSSFAGEVDRLQGYIDRNSEMIQKYISERKDLIETVLNTQITNYLRHVTN